MRELSRSRRRRSSRRPRTPRGTPQDSNSMPCISSSSSGRSSQQVNGTTQAGSRAGQLHPNRGSGMKHDARAAAWHRLRFRLRVKVRVRLRAKVRVRVGREGGGLAQAYVQA